MDAKGADVLDGIFDDDFDDGPDEIDRALAESTKSSAAKVDRRRAHSRRRVRRARVTASHSSQPSQPSSPSSPSSHSSHSSHSLQSGAGSTRRVAEEVARRVSASDAASGAANGDENNLDLKCEVSGITHRGGFRLRVVRLEEMTSAMVDRWRALCLARGYASTISFDVTASEATIVATPLFQPASASWTKWCAKLDPLHSVFAAALVLNVLRHALVHFA